jgi:hypothetical protein
MRHEDVKQCINDDDSEKSTKQHPTSNSPETQIGRSASDGYRRDDWRDEAHRQLDLILPQVDERVTLALGERFFRWRGASQERRSVVTHRPVRKTKTITQKS